MIKIIKYEQPKYKTLALGIGPYIKDFDQYKFEIDFDSIEDDNDGFDIIVKFNANINVNDTILKTRIYIFVSKDDLDEAILNRKSHVRGYRLLIENIYEVLDNPIDDKRLKFIVHDISYNRDADYGLRLSY